jgi:hypothetical protein
MGHSAKRYPLLSILLSAALSAGFAGARPGEATALYCERFRPELRLWLAQARAGEALRGAAARTPAATSAERDFRAIFARADWATGRLRATQGWLDELDGLAGASKVRPVVSRVAMEWVTLNAQAEARDAAGVDRTLARIEAWAATAERDWCGERR